MGPEDIAQTLVTLAPRRGELLRQGVSPRVVEAVRAVNYPRQRDLARPLPAPFEGSALLLAQGLFILSPVELGGGFKFRSTATVFEMMGRHWAWFGDVGEHRLLVGQELAVYIMPSSFPTNVERLAPNESSFVKLLSKVVEFYRSATKASLDLQRDLAQLLGEACAEGLKRVAGLDVQEEQLKRTHALGEGAAALMKAGYPVGLAAGGILGGQSRHITEDGIECYERPFRVLPAGPGWELWESSPIALDRVTHHPTVQQAVAHYLNRRSLQ